MTSSPPIVTTKNIVTMIRSLKVETSITTIRIQKFHHQILLMHVFKLTSPFNDGWTQEFYREQISRNDPDRIDYKEPWVYESPDGGETITKRKPGSLEKYPVTRDEINEHYKNLGNATNASTSVNESLTDAEQSLRNALAFAARGERPFGLHHNRRHDF